jgi:hypothetical protein
MDLITSGSLAVLALLPSFDSSAIPLTESIPLEKKVETGFAFIRNDYEHIELAVPYINQYYDLPEPRKSEIMWSACGPTALAMSFQFHGIDTDLISVIDGLPNDVYVKGVMFYNLEKGAELYDFESVTLERSAKGIHGALEKGYPVIINVQNYMGYVGHALVVTGMKGYNPETGVAVSLIVHDPTGGESKEFAFEGATTLRQPEGFLNYLGILDPFYIKPKHNQH